MSTISVPLSADLMNSLDTLVRESGASRAAVMRRALEKLAEDEAINAVLAAQREVKEGKVVRGDLQTLLAS